MRFMNFVSAAIGLAFAAAVTHAPAIASEVAVDTAVPAFNPHGFQFPAGIYRCELNRSVHVRQVSADLQSAVLHWDKKEYTLRAVNARTGALRYEDPKSGLVWLVIVGKSMLLDTKQGRQLANECKT